MAERGTPVKSLQSAMKMAKEAIQLDGENRHQEAYCQYLRTIAFISQVLLDQAEGGASQVEVGRMLRVAEQCLERARSFAGMPSDLRADPPQAELMLQVVATAPPTNDVTAPPSDGDAPFFIPPEVFQRWQTMAGQDSDRKLLTPIEEASRLNQKLRTSYEARLARLSPAQSYQKTSLTLSLQRQMMENLIIAKARQDALQRKMEERRVRLQEAANRRFSASGSMTAEEQEQRALYANVLEYEQEHDWPKLWKADLKKNPSDPTLVSGLVCYLLGRSDHPVVKLLKKYQYRIYNQLYPIISKVPAGQSLSRQSRNLVAPGVSTLAQSGGSSMQSLSGSSMTVSQALSLEGDRNPSKLPADRDNSFEDLEEFLRDMDLASPLPGAEVAALMGKLSSPLDQDEGLVSEQEMRALKEHLKSVVKEIHIAIDQLLSLCLLSFECLNTAVFKDLCLASIEEVFFTPLWGALVALFRKVHRERELACDASMRLYSDVPPVDLGVPVQLAPPTQDRPPGSFPYESAVQELKHVVGDCCPQRKLDCIVRTLRLICACAEDYRSQHKSESPLTTAAIGADDLLPILSFVVLRSRTPALVSECAALEEFIHEGLLIGEEGYCLTSLRSALSYVEMLRGSQPQYS